MLTNTQLRSLRAEPVNGPTRLGRNGLTRLGRAMVLAGVTQVQLADGANLTQPYISAILNGKAPKLPLVTAQRLAAFFGCAIEDLFPLTDDSEEGAA